MEPCECEVQISDPEHVARALYYSFHLDKKNRLKWQAFDSGSEISLSVMRAECLTPSACKARALQIESATKRYRGFALINVGELRISSCDVIDSRDQFCGHADLVLPLALPAEQQVGEPPDDQSYRSAQKDFAVKLVGLALCRIDPAPDAHEWPASMPFLPGKG